ncbi:hypothetical protein EVAR_55171_1 [Eumeta japonica]|uniref:Uncharacterized protein n=1 Tax=Eumeta variegata TaxID=151549 RepID=A0A4C1Y7R9_EUMVA|nr:hypothetical protein EVAR_55171_1 [Eumeta japonica]
MTAWDGLPLDDDLVRVVVVRVRAAKRKTAARPDADRERQLAIDRWLLKIFSAVLSIVQNRRITIRPRRKKDYGTSSERTSSFRVKYIHKYKLFIRIRIHFNKTRAAGRRGCGRKRHGRVKTGNGQDDRILSAPVRPPCCDVMTPTPPPLGASACFSGGIGTLSR